MQASAEKEILVEGFLALSTVFDTRTGELQTVIGNSPTVQTCALGVYITGQECPLSALAQSKAPQYRPAICKPTSRSILAQRTSAQGSR